MLSAVVIDVTPTTEAAISPDTGWAIRAWFLDRVRERDEALAAAIHDGDVEPFTVSDVFRLGPIRGGKRLLSPKQSGWLRITSLTAELTAVLDQIVAGLPGSSLSLAGAQLRIDRVSTTHAQHERAGRASPEAFRGITGGAQELTLRFFSTTTFKSDGRNAAFPDAPPFDMVFPLPGLVFGTTLLDKWNAFVPLEPMPVDTQHYAQAHLAAKVVKDLNSRLVTIRVHGERRDMRGCVGTCTYEVFDADSGWLSVIHKLATYAFFAGVGTRTTYGLGQAVLWDDAANRPLVPRWIR